MQIRQTSETIKSSILLKQRGSRKARISTLWSLPQVSILSPQKIETNLKLFEEIIDPKTNLLNKDGEVNYHGQVVDKKESNYFFDAMMNEIEWRHDEAVIFGRHIVTKRKVAWYGDESFEYTYSNKTRTALPWTKDLLKLKELVEKETNELFNSCLLNLYHNGDEGMAWHSDDEKDLKKDGTIASLSFGAIRKFSMKHRTEKENKLAIFLEPGSLLVMKGTTQTYWLHSLPKSKKVSTPRVNLTFRQMV